MLKLNATGVVLRARGFSDADKNYTVFTKEFGKVSVIAKGVRKITSKRAGSLDTLNLIKFSFTENKGFRYLVEVSCVDSFSKLKKTVPDFKHLYLVAELLNNFMQEDEPNASVFELLVFTLSKMKKADENTKRLLVLNFEFKILTFLGFDPILDFCALCSNDFSENRFPFGISFSTGGVICNLCKTTDAKSLSREAVKFLLNLRVSKEGEVFSIKVSSSVFSEVEKVVCEYTEHILESPLKSLTVFEKVG